MNHPMQVLAPGTALWRAWSRCGEVVMRFAKLRAVCGGGIPTRFSV